jgi:citrate lyase gamma subunit
MNNAINNTILFTPSNEQLIALAKEHPELNTEIKQQLLDELKTKCIKYISNRVHTRATSTYEALLQNVEKKLFKPGSNSYYNRTYNFEDSVEKSITSAIEKQFADRLEAEFNEYLTSDEFKNTLKAELKKRVLNAVVKALDTEIVNQANAFIKA